MEVKSIRTHLSDLYKRPTAQEEINSLCHSAQCGDLLAVSRLVQAHQKLVRLVADQFQDQGLTPMEIQYTGIIGLIKAIHRYHKGRDIEFKNYAIWWIKQSMQKAIEEEKRIKEVAHFNVEDMTNIPSSFKMWELRFQKDPEQKDIDELLDSTIEKANIALLAMKPELRYQWLPKAKAQ